MTRHGILALKGAHCASCAFTIEHMGRKIKDIDNIRVQAAEEKIYVEYHGSARVLDRIADIVKKIGYEATVIEKDDKTA